MFLVEADEPSEISTTSTEATTVLADEEKPAPFEETTPRTTTTVVKKAPVFVRPLVTEMELPEGGVAK